MRYDDQIHLDGYVSRRNYPRIHRDTYDMCAQHLTGEGVVLDLCCSTGLLGAHLRDSLGMTVAFADRDADALDRGVAAGTIRGETVLLGDLDAVSVPMLGQWLRRARVTAVVARRALYAVSDTCPLPLLRDTLKAAGVREVVLEGLRLNGRSVHPFGPANVQAAALGPDYEVVASLRDVRYLRLTT